GREEAKRARSTRHALEHVDVPVEVVDVLIVTGSTIEVDTGVNLLEHDAEPDVLQVGLNHGLGRLAHGVDGGSVHKLESPAVLLAHTIIVEHPASILQHLSGGFRIENTLGVRRIRAWVTVKNIGGWFLTKAVELVR